MGSEVKSGEQIIVSSGFNTKYWLAKFQVYQLKQLLCNSSFLNNLKLLFANPSDFVNSLKMYPINIRKFVKGLYSEMIIGKNIGTDIYCYKISSIDRSYLIGNIKITKRYNNFLDYEPYTKIELYVPYFSFITLPVNDIMGKQINLYLSVDFDTGIGTLYIQCEGRVILTTSAKLGIDVPIGSSNYNEVVKDNFISGVKGSVGLVGMAVGGGLAKLGGGALALSSAYEIARNGVVRYNRGSLTGGNDMLGSPTSIYAIITRPNALPIDENYNRIKGKPLGESRLLSTMHGFTIVSQIHLSNMPNVLDEEMKEIESLLHMGVEL